ncbi:MAG: LLM class flavin-dependent oxidoreductase [Gammaproteobacteria bacterium]|nr:LLM class flavin-dependent oxidoreductase [Gammaproteobacteria bacterium]
MPHIDFGFPIPQVFLDGKADLDLVRRTLALGEELGFDSAWVQDQVAGDVPLHESLTLLSYASALTTRVRLGVSVLVFPIRNAVHVAKIVSTLDNLSAGRIILGIGLGHVMAPGFFRTYGIESTEAVRRFNEGVRVMKSLWTEPVTNFEGEFYQLRQTGMWPKPVQKPHVPLWFGGQHPDALRRAVRYADGYTCAGPNTTEHFAGFVAQIHQFLDEEGRDPATLPLSKRVYIGIDDNAERAKRRLDEFFQARYPWQIERNPDFVADICAWGSTAQVADGLARVARIGATTIIANPLWDFEEQVAALAEEVIPAVRSTV